ncbi:MAG: outer membrane protein transport protein [Flavobacteriaceae bacterium]|nr:outer membrane protein transport protein [Flavobacteriaceae bacterium]
MKKIVYFIGLFLTAQLGFSQQDYNLLISQKHSGVLFSQEKINGTARFNGLSGAFGALGGDLSAIGINPAGGSVFNQTNLSATLGITNDVIEVSYNEMVNKPDNDYNGLSQAGGIFVFRSSYKNKGWNKTTFSFNFNNAYDFRELWVAKNNKIMEYSVAKQILPLSFESVKDGKNKKSTFGFSTKYNNDLYIGVALNTYELNFNQRATLMENNLNVVNEIIDIQHQQELFIMGNGVSMSFGVIAKPVKNLRLGIAYHSPTWYNLTEEVQEEQREFRNGSSYKANPKIYDPSEYKLKTPSKIIGSIAYVFGKKGLISLDYTRKNYRNISYQSGDFGFVNEQLNNDLRSVWELRLGTEWVINKFYARGGFHYEKNPFKGGKKTDDLRGFSLGTGYKFKGGRFDIAYQKQYQTDFYNFEPSPMSIELSQNKGIITATLSISL